MAKITPIDIIKGVSGKFGGNSKEYFATNKTSYNIYFAKRVNEFKGPATQKQLEIRDRFKAKQKAVADWLRANRPVNGRPATEAYRVALALKYRYKFSSINQVIHKYLNDDLQVVLPNSGNDADSEAPKPSPSQPGNKPSGGNPSGGASGDNAGAGGGSQVGGGSDAGSHPQPSGKKTLTLVANPAEGGTLTGAGTYDAGTHVEVTAIANEGYEFSQWDDGDDFPTRNVTMNEDMTLTATFKPVKNTEEGGDHNTEQGGDHSTEQGGDHNTEQGGDKNTDEGGLGA